MAEQQYSSKSAGEYIDTYVWGFEDDPVGADAGDAGAGSHGLNDNIKNMADEIKALHETEQYGLQAILSNGNAVIGIGQQVDILVPYDCTILEADLLADQSGDIVIDVLQTTYSGFDGSLASITGTGTFQLSSAIKTQDTALTGWTVTLTKGDVLRFSVTSTPVNVQRVLVAFKIRRTE